MKEAGGQMQKLVDGKWVDMGEISGEGSQVVDAGADPVEVSGEEDVNGVVGRPLTPGSVAGVSRRVSRRTARRNSFLLQADGDVSPADADDETCTCSAAAEVASGTAFCGIADEDGEDSTAGVVGRPATPVSVAGTSRRVSRRTSRRNSLLMMLLNKDGKMTRVAAVSDHYNYGIRNGYALDDQTRAFAADGQLNKASSPGAAGAETTPMVVVGV